MAKNWLYEKQYNLETEKDCSSKLDTTTTGNNNVWKFGICVLWTDWEVNRQKESVTGRVGPGEFITDIDYMVKKKDFLFIKHYRKKINSFRDLALFLFPILLWKEALDCELAPPRSASLAIILRSRHLLKCYLILQLSRRCASLCTEHFTSHQYIIPL